MTKGPAIFDPVCLLDGRVGRVAGGYLSYAGGLETVVSAIEVRVEGEDEPRWLAAPCVVPYDQVLWCEIDEVTPPAGIELVFI